MRWKCGSHVRAVIQTIVDGHDQACASEVSPSQLERFRVCLAAEKTEGVTLSLEDVRVVQRFLSTTASGGRLHELLHGATAILEGLEQRGKARTEAEQQAIKARREALQRRADQRKYDEMVASITPQNVTTGAQEFRLFRQQASIGMSVLVSVFTAGLAGYYIGRTFFPEDEQLALVLALGFSIAMLLVDSVLVILRLTRAK